MFICSIETIGGMIKPGEAGVAVAREDETTAERKARWATVRALGWRGFVQRSGGKLYTWVDPVGGGGVRRGKCVKSEA